MAVPKYVPRSQRGRQPRWPGPAPTSVPLSHAQEQMQMTNEQEHLQRARTRAATFKEGSRGHNDALLDGVVRAINVQTGELTVEFDPITSPCVDGTVADKRARALKGETVKINALLFHHARELTLVDKANAPVFVEPRKTRRDL